MDEDENIGRKRLEKEKLTDEEVNLLYDIIEVTDKILTEHNIPYILEGGSLLGACRCGGLMAHDNDADFDILESDLPRIICLTDEFAKYNMVIIKVPGWGLQISHKNSPDLIPGMWTDGTTTWTSKWPFLDLITIKKSEDGSKYVLAGEVAFHDYPNYYLTIDDWESSHKKISFGHLSLWSIAEESNKKAYLDRHYPGWQDIIEMVMDHRENIYFDQPIICKVTESDKCYRPKKFQ